MSKKNISFVFIVLAGVLWGCIGLFVRTINAWGIASMELVSLRAIVTAVVMFFVLLIKDKSLLKIKLKDLWCFIGTGIFSVNFFNFCYFKTITLSSLSVAAVLLYTAPTFVMVMSYFLFKEKFTSRKVIALVITFVGCLFVTGVFSSSISMTPLSVLTGLGAGFGYALYSIFSRYAIERGYGSFTITFYTFLIAAVGSLFIANMSIVSNTLFVDPLRIVISVGFGIVSTILPYLFYTAGLKEVENGKASIIVSIEPVTATILGLIVFGESLTVSGVIGIVLVIAALVICNVEEKT
ncbi:MAG: DMT family transporter [Saccharofermentans sp.]|nr:DMT family transporter [Saccharofermentans sp.]